MTDKKLAALQAALERLEHLEFNKPHVRGTDDCHEDIIEEIRAALAEQEVEQEPVAWLCGGSLFHSPAAIPASLLPPVGNIVPLYTAPPRREWKRLTDEEIAEVHRVCKYDASPWPLSRAIEAALKEKNHE